MIGVLLVGLPVLAVVAGRVLPAPRNRPNPLVRDPAEIVRTEFGLTWQDQAEVAAALRDARTAVRPELRPATRRLAELTLHPPYPTFRGRPISDYPRWQRTTARIAFAAVLLGYFSVTVRHGRPEGVVVPAGYAVLLLAVTPVLRRRRRNRALNTLAANQDGPAPS